MDLDVLRDQLLAADYRFDSVVGRLGEVALAALGRNATVAARRALGDDPQSVLVRLWLLHDVLPVAHVRRVLGPAVDWLLGNGLLVLSGDEVRAAAEIRPYADDEGLDGWICADLIPSLDSVVAPIRPDFVLGASPASATLAQMCSRSSSGLALDLGSGCGVQSLHLASRGNRVVATDVNPRALWFTRISAGLSGFEVDVREGSLFDPVSDLSFDLIVTNPPYVMSPPKASSLTYREAGFVGDELVRQVVTGGGQRLAQNGSMQVLANWAVLAGQPWEDRVAGWVRDSGCDGLVVLREQLDVCGYIEIWLADAGVSGDEYRRRYGEWLDYFESLGVESVQMGWFTLKNAGRDVPVVECETLPDAVVGPVAPALDAFHLGVAATAASDAELLGERWELKDKVRQETIGLAGAAHPEALTLRQYYGLGRQVGVDTVLAAVVGVCDGDLTLGQIVAGVAAVLDLSEAEVLADVLPQFRRLLVRDWFDVSRFH